MKKFTLQIIKHAAALLLFSLPLVLQAQFDSLSNFRHYDKRGINVFEPAKQPAWHIYIVLKYPLPVARLKI